MKALAETALPAAAAGPKRCAQPCSARPRAGSPAACAADPRSPRQRRGVAGAVGAQLVLCAQRGAAPAAAAAAAAGWAPRQHPDLIWIGPEEDSRQLRIEQVRDARRRSSPSPATRVATRSASSRPADLLNRFAANALLKTLEEPAARTLLILVVDPALAAAADRSQPLPAAARARPRAARRASPGCTAARGPRRSGMRRWMRSGRRRSSPCARTRRRSPPSAPRRAARWRPWRLAAPIRWPRPSAGRARNCALRLQCFENWLTERIRRGRAGRGLSDRNARWPPLATGHSGLEYTRALPAG